MIDTSMLAHNFEQKFRLDKYHGLDIVEKHTIHKNTMTPLCLQGKSGSMKKEAAVVVNQTKSRKTIQ